MCDEIVVETALLLTSAMSSSSAQPIPGIRELRIPEIYRYESCEGISAAPKLHKVVSL